MTMRTAFTYIAILLLAGCATTGPTSSTRYWKLEQCTNAPNPRLNFNRPDGTRIATIDRLVCERAQTAATKIQNAASYQVSQIYIADLEAVNAGATFDKNGNPIVIVNIGMLQAMGADEDAWAGLLGHEIAHLVRNHREGREGAKSAAEVGGQVVGNILSYLVPGVGGWAAGTVAGTATQWAMYGAYTRPQEAEADQLGLTWMVAAGYEPRGLTRLFDILATQRSLPAFLSTHPGAEDRTKTVQDYINKTGQAVASPDVGQRRLPPCPGSNTLTWTNCVGAITWPTGWKYVGEFKDGNYNGQATVTYADGGKYIGEYRNGVRSGRGVEYNPDGTVLQSAIWENGNLVNVREPPVVVSSTASAREQADIAQKPSSDLERRFAAARAANDRKPENNAIAVAKGSSRWAWGTSWSAGTENRARELALDYCKKQASKEGITDSCRVYSVNGRVVHDDAK